MGRVWSLADAGNQLSEVVDLAMGEGPQTITRGGKAVAVVVSIEAFRRLSERKDFLRYLLAMPRGTDVDLERDADPGRDVDL